MTREDRLEHFFFSKGEKEKVKLDIDSLVKTPGVFSAKDKTLQLRGIEDKLNGKLEALNGLLKHLVSLFLYILCWRSPVRFSVSPTPFLLFSGLCSCRFKYP